MVLIISYYKPLHKDLETYLKTNFPKIVIDKAFHDLEGIKKIEENSRYELIISDWDNGYVNGYDILQRVRKSPTTKTIPFVVITERRDKESVLACIHASVSGFIMKPPMSQTIDEKTIEEKLRPFFEKISTRNEGITIL